MVKIVGNTFDIPENTEYEGKEILKVLHVVINETKGELVWNCIMADATTQTIPKSFFEELLDEEIIFGVE